MQLKQRKNLRYGLAIATSTLLASSASGVAAKEPWKIDTGLLFYQEQDGRVQDIGFRVVGSRDQGDDDNVNFSFEIDTLTGASPSGAITLDQAQTVTRPSGIDSYTVAPGELALDNTFTDDRAAITGNLARGLTEDSRYTVGFSLSKEFDYLHLGANGSYSRDFNNKNTILSAGIAVASDEIQAVGGTPIPFALVRPVGVAPARNGDQSKTVIDGLFGITQIINRRSLIQLNYTISQSDGYLNDPYKLLTVLDSGTGEPIESSDPGLLEYRYENRPDTRLGHNFYTEYKYRFDSGIANLGYRFHTDDFGIDSHTVEFRYRWLINDKQYLEPNLRFYTQTAADFYTPFLTNGPLPEFASGDYRLGAFNGVTLGLSYNQKIGKDSALGIGFETYQTTGDDESRPSADGSVRTVKYPDLSATIVRINYKFEW